MYFFSIANCFFKSYYVFDFVLYLGPAWDVKQKKRLDVCAQGFWARTPTRDRYTSIFIMSRRKAPEHTTQ